MIKNSPREAGWARARRLLLVAALGAAGCQLARAAPEEEMYQGTAELEERRLSFEVGGRITSLTAREGDAVQRGALLATVDDALDEQARAARDLEARAAHAQATVVDKGVRPEEIAVTRAKIRAAKAGEDLVKKQLEREKDLAAHDVTPQSRVDELEAQYQRSVADREALESLLSEQQRGARPEERAAARAKADAAQASVALDDLRIERRELRAPADGVVLDRHVESGEVVQAGAPVLTVADPKRLYAVVFVPQGKLPGIDVGDRARLRADGIEGALEGHVEHIARRTEFTPRYLFSETERANFVVRVKVRIDDPGAQLHAGVPVRVSIDRNTPADQRARIEPPPDAVPSASAAPAVPASAAATKSRRP
ncbi:MAG TPA: HlyD family efflux transporter periplasmic adaptor subunit [Polyangiaceae bacterium]|nr:HlyD family efflux transporter periplasmic adaptor subunit [Polyangiaceae bacterium]